MSNTRRTVGISRGGPRRLATGLALLAVATVSFLTAADARANMGYELSTVDPVLVAGIAFPHGVAVDQTDHRVYVAVLTANFLSQAPGQIRRFESDGTPAGSFGAAPQAFFSGVAVNPLTHGFYGSQVRVESEMANFGIAQMDPFSPEGVVGTPFPLSVTDTLPQIATDSTGDVFYPDDSMNSVRVFDSAGALQEVIDCSECPGGAFGMPASVALDSEDNLYVVDFAPDRVVKLALSAGSYKFASILQSGRGAGAVGVDPSNDAVFVGDFPKGTRYHVVAYTSAGLQFDDFGAGLFIDPPLGLGVVAQIAADATTHKLYLTETNKVYVFEKVVIGPPTATPEPASAVGQLAATLNATANAKGHATIECDFELTLAADVGFANPTSLPCAHGLDGSLDTPIEATASGLSPGTAYRYRATATSNGGPVTSDSETFETLPAVPPTVTTDAPLSVTQTSAAIRGKVNPHGGVASSCRFEVGASTSYGTNLPCLPLPAPETTDVAESRQLLGLSPGTVYHYRLVVTTNAGTDAGDDVEFKTLAASSSNPTPTAPPATGSPPAEGPLVAPPPRRCKKGFRSRTVGGKRKCVKICPRPHRSRARALASAKRSGGAKCGRPKKR